MNDVATIMSVTVLVATFALAANAFLVGIDRRMQSGTHVSDEASGARPNLIGATS
jgi:hypothetical protein